MKDPTFAPVYASLFVALSEIVREKGYALSIHGTLQSDFDLVAIPWVDEAIEPMELVHVVGDYVHAILGANHDLAPIGEPELKPHGRKAWSIPMGGGAVIDLSIMPKVATRMEDVFSIKLGNAFKLLHFRHSALNLAASVFIDKLKKGKAIYGEFIPSEEKHHRHLHWNTDRFQTSDEKRIAFKVVDFDVETCKPGEYGMETYILHIKPCGPFGEYTLNKLKNNIELDIKPRLTVDSADGSITIHGFDLISE